MDENRIKVNGELKKHPSEMVNIELMETYSHFNKMPLRLKDEQNYLGLLHQEIMKRMSKSLKN